MQFSKSLQGSKWAITMCRVSIESPSLLFRLIWNFLVIFAHSTFISFLLFGTFLLTYFSRFNEFFVLLFSRILPCSKSVYTYILWYVLCCLNARLLTLNSLMPFYCFTHYQWLTFPWLPILKGCIFSSHFMIVFTLCMFLHGE